MSRAIAAGAAVAAVIAFIALVRDDDGSPAGAATTAPEAPSTARGSTSAVTTAATRPAPGPSTTAPRTAAATTAAATPPSLPPYTLAATRRCLISAGFAVSPIRSDDQRLRALGDLAQRTSLELRLAGQTLGLAFGDTRLLASLLAVPNDPYRLEVRRNALLMYRPTARREAERVRDCLRS
jgi:hypothetical protein